jgi:hypothetical protein
MAAICLQPLSWHPKDRLQAAPDGNAQRENSTNVQKLRLVLQGLQALHRASASGRGRDSAAAGSPGVCCWLARVRKDFGVQPYSSLNSLLK